MKASIKLFTEQMGLILVLGLILVSASVSAQSINAYLYLAQFNSPESGPYIETYLNVEGKTATFTKNEKNEFKSELEILYLFKQNGEIKAFEKYTLNSPIIKDSITFYPNFTDVQRISIPNGIYNFELHITDLMDTNNTYTYSNIITVDMNEAFQFSDIELVESYKPSEKNSAITKNGIDIVPYAFNFFPDFHDKITFYTEIYSKGKAEDYLFQYYVEDSKTKIKLNAFASSKKVHINGVAPILQSFSIAELHTGNYNLVLSLRNKKNEELTKKVFFFQRINNKHIELQDTVLSDKSSIPEIQEINNIEKMQTYIECLFPILNQRDLFKANNVLKSDDINLMKNFFNNYWETASSDPVQDWSIYKKNVERVNRSYSSQIKKGYESDRGRCFLKYGMPNDINKSDHEPSTYPYEIWHYFEVNGETNRKFIFYNPELVGEDYVLLHSDLTGEMSNQYWQRDLTKRNSSSPNSLDDTNGQNQYGNRSQDIYNR